VSFEEQISKDKYPSILILLAPNGGYFVYHPSNTFHNTRGLENWEYYPDISPGLAGDYHSNIPQI